MKNLQVLIASTVILAAPAHAETFREVNGVVSMEAEHFTSNDGYTVRSDNGPNDVAAGWSGDGWVYSDSSTAQRMDYRITFSHSGTYYVHLRGLAGFNADWSTNYEGLDNGYHAEIDGVRISGPGIFMRKTQKWVWFGSFQHSSASEGVSFTVATPGQHTFSIVRREQLSRLDKIVIHDGTYGTDAASTLSGAGPAETLDTGNPPDGGDDRVRIEAEDMTLQAYRVEDGTGYASNNQMVSLRDGEAGETGTATHSFGGTPGYYDVVLAYFDENDGVASLQLRIDEALIDSFDLDQNLGDPSSSAESLVRRTVARGRALTAGTRITITGIEDPNEPARVDYVELIPVSAAPNAGRVDAGRPDAIVNDSATATDLGSTDDVEVSGNGDPSQDSSTGTCGCRAVRGHTSRQAVFYAGMLLGPVMLRAGRRGR